MTWGDWLAARQLLYEERLGVHLRARDTEALAEEQRQAELYRRSVARLKQQQQD